MSLHQFWHAILRAVHTLPVIIGFAIALLFTPLSAQAQPSFELLVSSGTELHDSQVLRYESNGNYLGVFIPPGTGLYRPRGLVFGPDGALYVCSAFGDSVLRYDGQTGAFLNAFIPPGSGGLNGPIRTIFRDNLVYVSGFGTNPDPVVVDGHVNVYHAATGEYLWTLIPPGTGGLVNADDIVIGQDDHLYVSSVNGNEDVLKFNRFTGEFLGRFATYSGMRSPRGLTFRGGTLPGDPLYLYVANGTQDTVLRFDGITGTYLLDFLAPSPSPVNEPRQIEFGPDGHLYVASRFSNQILRYHGETGAFLGVAVEGNGLFEPTYFTFRQTQPQTILDGFINLEECVNPVVPIQLVFYSFNQPTPLYREVMLSYIDFSFGYFQITDLPPDFYYLVTIKGDRWLSDSTLADLTFGAWGLSAFLRAGDANNDNVVDISDLLIIIAHYNQVLPSPGYLEAADFNNDGATDIADLLLLIRNYNQMGF